LAETVRWPQWSRQLVPKLRSSDMKRPVAQTSSGPQYDTCDGTRWAEMVTGLTHQLAQCYLQTGYCPLYQLTTCFQHSPVYIENMLLAGTRDNKLSVGSIVQVGAWGQSPSLLIWRHHMCMVKKIWRYVKPYLSDTET